MGFFRNLRDTGQPTISLHLLLRSLGISPAHPDHQMHHCHHRHCLVLGRYSYQTHHTNHHPFCALFLPVKPLQHEIINMEETNRTENLKNVTVAVLTLSHTILTFNNPEEYHYAF